eukprot:2705596-Pleurochrysis_carterae.AAC.1
MPEAPSSRSFASSLASRSNVCSCSTYAVRLGKETAKPVLPRKQAGPEGPPRPAASSRSSARQAAARRGARTRWPLQRALRASWRAWPC